MLVAALVVEWLPSWVREVCLWPLSSRGSVILVYWHLVCFGDESFAPQLIFPGEAKFS